MAPQDLFLRKAISLKMKLWGPPFWQNKLYRSTVKPEEENYKANSGKVGISCLEGGRSFQSLLPQTSKINIASVSHLETTSSGMASVQPPSSSQGWQHPFPLTCREHSCVSLKKCVMAGRVLPQNSKLDKKANSKMYIFHTCVLFCFTSSGNFLL